MNRKFLSKPFHFIPFFIIATIIISITALITLSASARQDSPYEQKRLSIVPDENETRAFHKNIATTIDNSRKTKFSSSAEKSAPVNPRMIAEWEPMKAAVIRYPLGIPMNLVKLLADEDQVCVILSTSLESTATNSFKTAGVKMDNIKFIKAATDSYWTRDYSAWWVMVGSTGERHCEVVDPMYYPERTNDDNIPKVLADYLNKKTYYPLNMYVEGGNMMTDGIKVGTSTNRVLDKNSQSADSLKKLTGSILGFSPYNIIDDTTGTYIKHIDCWAKYIAENKVLVRRVPQRSSAYQKTEEAAKNFANTKNGNGVPFTVYRVDTPSDQPYVNHLVLNKRVFIPITGSTPSSADKTALAQIQEAYGSDYKVVSVPQDYSHQWLPTDSLHCRVNSIPDFDKIKN
jgi:agmatine deiminase